MRRVDRFHGGRLNGNPTPQLSIDPAAANRCGRPDASPQATEHAARAAFNERVGRTLTDSEWVATRTKLLDFAGILRGWDRKTTASRRGNVEVLCQREP